MKSYLIYRFYKFFKIEPLSLLDFVDILTMPKFGDGTLNTVNRRFTVFKVNKTRIYAGI
jgi:cyanate lyase